MLSALVFTLARALGRCRTSESSHLHHPLGDMKGRDATLNCLNTICTGGLLGLVVEVKLLLEVTASRLAGWSDDAVVLAVWDINSAHMLHVGHCMWGSSLKL
jgi:hypothetical protein